VSPANLLRTAWRGALANKLRAGLTMLGIVIGVASVIVMLALGNGARAAVDANFRWLGSDEVRVSMRQVNQNGQIVPAGRLLTYEDGLALPGSVPRVDWVSMTVGGPGRVRFGRNVSQVFFQGVTADELRAQLAGGQVEPAHWPPPAGAAVGDNRPFTAPDFMADGRFFSPAEVLAGEDVCVLAWRTARDLFEGDDPIGATVWVNRRPCTVIGTLIELVPSDPRQRYTSTVNDGVYLPISTAIREQFTSEPPVQIEAHVIDSNAIREAEGDIARYLRGRHSIDKDQQGNYKDDFDLTTRDDVLGAQLAAARTFSLLLAAMAVVSLVVGGIGIMNVMLVSVSERTPEIGVRLAVGAQPADVVGQFLLEAVLISAAGGLVGSVAGVLTIPLAARLNQGVALLDPGSLPLALGVALLTGVAFGLYPALRASRLDPMKALRYE
jgi:putative ABC transport system permease protein